MLIQLATIHIFVFTLQQHLRNIEFNNSFATINSATIYHINVSIVLSTEKSDDIPIVAPIITYPYKITFPIVPDLPVITPPNPLIFISGAVL